MNTPICDFVQRYADSHTLRLHMPGHKGCSFLGMEALDITEIDGADSLYEAAGIIRESEKNAGTLFGCPTFYSTEGSSQCIRAILYLALLHAKQTGKAPVIAAGRNAHKAFLSAAALLDLDVQWLYPADRESYLSCGLDAASLERYLHTASPKPAAVYLTSPDYLGRIADIAALAQVCHAHGALLLVDNAHGAYLRFLPEPQHPICLGADLCCDSAHKTLPVLTGGAYLHISPAAPALMTRQAKNALLLFGSTSPSYLILQSLDAANRYLSQGYSERLSRSMQQIAALKQELSAHGYTLYGQEPLKITLRTKPYGYRGQELAQILLQHNIACEFADPDHLVLMLTPETGADGLHRLREVLLGISPREAIRETPPHVHPGFPAMTIREAMFSPCETLPVEQCNGRILAAAAVGCPPAVPILVCGEVIDEEAIACFRYYGIGTCPVVCEP